MTCFCVRAKPGPVNPRQINQLHGAGMLESMPVGLARGDAGGARIDLDPAPSSRLGDREQSLLSGSFPGKS